MIGNARDLVPGNVYKTKPGEVYVYLGYYGGHPRSSYSRPYEGYLYMFHVSGRPPLNPDDIRQDIVARIDLGSIDGHACYTVHPKPFADYVGHVDLSSIKQEIQAPYGLRRLGDGRPQRRGNG